MLYEFTGNVRLITEGQNQKEAETEACKYGLKSPFNGSRLRFPMVYSNKLRFNTLNDYLVYLTKKFKVGPISVRLKDGTVKEY